MGTIRDIVKSVDNTQGVSAEIKETLGLLMSLAEAKGNAYEGMIKQDLTTGKMGDSLTVSITKVIQSRTEFRAVTKSGTDKIVDEIKKSMGNLFSGDGKILEGISGIVNTALAAIMGTGEGQEAEIRTYSVVTEYPAIVRLDFAFWGRNIQAQSIKNHMENVFTCVAYKSAVDVSKLAFNDFLSLYGPVLRAAYGNDQTRLKEMIQQAKEVYSMFNIKPLNMLPVDSEIDLVQNPRIKQPFSIRSMPATQGAF
jgi:hypothetical protein